MALPDLEKMYLKELESKYNCPVELEIKPLVIPLVVNGELNPGAFNKRKVYVNVLDNSYSEISDLLGSYKSLNELKDVLKKHEIMGMPKYEVKVDGIYSDLTYTGDGPEYSKKVADLTLDKLV